MPTGIYIRSEKQKEFARVIGKLYGGKKKVLKNKICITCKKEYSPKDSFVKYCSKDCFYNGRDKKGIYKNCIICNKEFYVSQCFKNSKYCSRECQHKGLIIKESKIKLKCTLCNKEYIRERAVLKNRGSRFCSMVCMDKFRKTKQYSNKLKRRTTASILKKTLWKIFSEYIRQRDRGVCISCGKKDFWRKMDAGHYIPKTAGLNLYFDEINVNCQCTYCNRWMHGNLSKYAIALINKYGDGIIKKLDIDRGIVRKITVEEYKQLIEEYKTKIAELSTD